MAAAVVLVEAGGIAVTNTTNATPFTVADNEIGLAITLVDAGGLPVTLLNEDGTAWEEPE